MLHGMKLSAFDLNHVRALHALLEEAHVARAARKLGITPPAASNALRRLRDDFDDPLLVRSGRTLVRTPFGETLRGPAREVLEAAARLFEAGAPFEPERDESEHLVVTSDRVAQALLPSLDRLLGERAPRASLFVYTQTASMAALLRDQGGVGIVPEREVERGLVATDLFTDEFVCVLRRNHPLTKGPWTVKRFAAAEHVLVAPRASSRTGIVDELLAEQGITRRVTRVVTSFALAVPLLTASDRIAVLPRSFVLAQPRERRLVVRAAPLAIPSLTMRLVWHPGVERDVRNVWLRSLVHDAVRMAELLGAAKPSRRE